MKLSSSLLLLASIGICDSFSFIRSKPVSLNVPVLFATKDEVKTPTPPSNPPPASTVYAANDDVDEDETNEMIQQAMKQLWEPIFSSEIERGVPPDSIKGAALTASVLSVYLLGLFPLSVPLISAIGAAYVAVTPGPGGNAVRSIGKVSWTLQQKFFEFVDRKAGLQLIKKSTPVEDKDLGDILEAASEAVKLAQKEISKGEETPEVKAKKISEEARIKAEEETRKEQEELEQERLQKEAEALLKLEEEEKQLEEASLAEEEDRLAAEEESDDDDDDDEFLLDEDDWEASIQLAQSLDQAEELVVNGDNEQWKEAQDLAKQLASDISNEEEEEESMDDVGKAAREAVAKFEAQMKRGEEFQSKQRTHQELDSSPVEIDNDVDFKSMKVVELKEELRSRGLKVSGKKAELIQRLEEYTLS